MGINSFVLALFVLLVSTVTYLEWFVVDKKLIGWVGFAFVIIFIIEAVRGRGRAAQ